MHGTSRLSATVIRGVGKFGGAWVRQPARSQVAAIRLIISQGSREVGVYFAAALVGLDLDLTGLAQPTRILGGDDSDVHDV